jgi:hypothetical protein
MHRGCIVTGIETIEICIEQRVVFYEGVEVEAIGEACGVRSEPASQGGSIISAAVVCEACLGVYAFGRKTPGADVFLLWLFPEGGLSIDDFLRGGC